MSVEAITWALKRPIKPSSTKFVLVVLANCADGHSFTCYPSIAYLVEATGQDRKTVLSNIQRLMMLGYIEDTGERKGSTKQIPIYRLVQPDDENGNNPENGTVPKFPSNSTVFPSKQSQNSRETVPKTGHGTVNEPSKEPSGNRHIKKGEYPEDFEQTFAAYPKRPGDSKSKAFKAWQARIKEGNLPETIYKGVVAYAGYIEARKQRPNFSTDYIKQAATFFGPDNFFMDDWTPRGVKPETPDEKNARIIAETMARRHGTPAPAGMPYPDDVIDGTHLIAPVKP